MTKSAPKDAPTLANCLILDHGFHEDDTSRVLEMLHPMEHRIEGLSDDQVTLKLMVKDRDGNDQKVTFEADLGRAHLVATADDGDLWAGVAHVRDELLRQYGDWKDTHLR